MRSLWSPDGDGRASRFVVGPSAAGQLTGRHGDGQILGGAGESEGDLLPGWGGGQCPGQGGRVRAVRVPG